jgi:hypothetical protein
MLEMLSEDDKINTSLFPKSNFFGMQRFSFGVESN